MWAFIFSEIAFRLIAAILGGFGVFFLIMSFAVPRLGAQAFLLLGTAAGIIYFAPSSRTRK